MIPCWICCYARAGRKIAQKGLRRAYCRPARSPARISLVMYDGRTHQPSGLRLKHDIEEQLRIGGFGEFFSIYHDTRSSDTSGVSCEARMG